MAAMVLRIFLFWSFLLATPHPIASVPSFLALSGDLAVVLVVWGFLSGFDYGKTNMPLIYERNSFPRAIHILTIRDMLESLLSLVSILVPLMVGYFVVSHFFSTQSPFIKILILYLSYAAVLATEVVIVFLFDRNKKE